MPVHESLISREYRKFLEERRSDWVESRQKLIEQFPFLTVITTMPYPTEMNVWKDEAHLDGFIYLFNDKAKEAVRAMRTAPDSVEEDVAAVEDGYFSNNLDECPYYTSYETFEDFLQYIAQRNRDLEKELEDYEVNSKATQAVLKVWEKRLVAAGLPLDIPAGTVEDSETENDN